MIINTNMNALNAHRNMGINNTQAGKSMEKLSSGLRINRAGDDAAGLAISEKMRGQIRGLDQASRNSQDGISMIQTAEGALNETQNILQRMRELSVQSTNDTNTAGDRTEIQKEIEQLTQEVDRIGNNTEFNTQKLLKGDGGIDLQKTDAFTMDPIVQGDEDKTQASATITITGTTGAIDDSLNINIGGKAIEVKLTAGTTSAADTATAFTTALSEAISKDDDLKGQFRVNSTGGVMTIAAVADGKYDGSAGTISAGIITGPASTSTAGVGITTQEAASTTLTFELGGNLAEANTTLKELLTKGFEINGQKVEFYNVNDGAYKGDAVGIDISKAIELGAVAGTGVDAVQGAFVDSIVNQIGNKLEGVTIEGTATAGEIVINTTEKGFDAKLTVKDGATKKDFAATFQVGANEGQTIKVEMSDMRAEALGVSKIDVTSKDAASKAITTLDDAVKNVSSERAKLGSVQNRLEYTTSNLNNTSENLTAAESRIRDVDMAKEMLNFSKNNILNQAAQSMLAQAKSQPEGVLQLLR